MLDRIFRGFQYREFRIMWFGACTSSIGTWMQELAQNWLVLQITGSAFLLGLDAFLGDIPIVLFSLVGGVFADRRERRKILLVSQFVQMTCAFVLATLLGFHAVHIWHILTLSFIVGVAQSFGGPAYSALIPSLVKPEDLPNAIALNSIQFNLARVIGPMLGGLALTNLGASWCFSLNGLSFLAVIGSLLLIHTHFTPKKTGQSVLFSMKEGFSFIRRQGTMESLIVLAFCMTLLAFPLVVFLPVFARDVFHKGPQLYTLFLCCSGAGSVTGALIVAAMGRFKRQGRAALVLLIFLGALVICFALSTNLIWSCVLLFISGGVLLAVFATISSLVQMLVADEMRGRVMSVYNVAFRGGIPIGSLIVGALVKQFTAPVVIACNGVILTVIGSYFLFVHRKIATL